MDILANGSRIACQSSFRQRATAALMPAALQPLIMMDLPSELKQFVVNNYTFERSLEDHSVTILKEIFEGLELEDTDKEAEEEFDAINDDNNDNVILMIDEHEDDDGDHEEELT